MSGQAFADELLAGRIAVCVGCGGVGKTTVAAALALAAARSGRHALVITIDPARRLADALGVELSDEPRRIESEHVDLGEGSLSALMLDRKHTFDGLVDRLAESDEARDRILSNAIYQHASDALAGSSEYSAMEKVYQMAADEAYDFIVVDTPPAQQALDFLDTPQRMIDFLDSRLVSGLIHPAFAAGRFGFKVFQGGAKRVLHLIERVSGVGFIEDISEFLLAFEGMSDGFRDRASRVKELLLGPESSFVLVTGPAHESVDQALLFLDRLEAYEVPLAGVVANRVREWPEGSPPRNLDSDGGDVGALAHALSLTAAGSQAEDAARAAVAAAAGYAGWVHRDAEALEPVREHAGIDGRFFRQIPELPQDVHDLDSLDRIAHYLFHRN